MKRSTLRRFFAVLINARVLFFFTYLYSDIYAEGYIVFIFPLIRLSVGKFVHSFLTMTTFLIIFFSSDVYLSNH